MTLEIPLGCSSLDGALHAFDGANNLSHSRSIYDDDSAVLFFSLQPSNDDNRKLPCTHTPSLDANFLNLLNDLFQPTASFHTFLPFLPQRRVLSSNGGAHERQRAVIVERSAYMFLFSFLFCTPNGDILNKETRHRLPPPLLLPTGKTWCALVIWAAWVVGESEIYITLGKQENKKRKEGNPREKQPRR